MSDYTIRWHTVEAALEKRGYRKDALKRVLASLEDVLNAIDRLDDRMVSALAELKEEEANAAELLSIGLAAKKACARTINEYLDLETVMMHEVLHGVRMAKTGRGKL